jgi:hypothetical protein
MDFDLARDFWANDGGSADDLVPSVDPADLRSVLDILRTSNPKAATGMGALARICRPGADLRAVWYRAAMLSLPSVAALFSRWIDDGKFDDAVLRVGARFPMKKLRVSIVHQGFPFEVEEFVRQIEADTDI